MKQNVLNKLLIFNILIYFSIISCTSKMNEISKNFDWQGHRGCRGMLPENSIPAFLKALELGVNTLELDVAISSDLQVVVSHEPWMSGEICQKPDGTKISAQDEEQLALYKMTYQAIKNYDCGSKGNSRFPYQEKQAVYKPLLKEVITAIKTYCNQQNKPLPQFNIEIKSQPKWDNYLTPPIAQFADLVIEIVEYEQITNNVCIQSFDPRAIENIHTLRPNLKIAFLVENTEGVEANLKRLTFKPPVYSPYYLLLRKKDIALLHEQGIKVIPWTVNNEQDMSRLIKWGVDGIITDYPNKIALLKK